MTDIKRLANKINSYFVGLTDHFPPLCQGVPPLSVPDELLISEYEAYKSLSSLQTSKAVSQHSERFCFGISPPRLWHASP